MASIGQFTVTAFIGRLFDAEPSTELVSRQGLDGYGVIFDAWRAQPVAITTRTVIASLTAADQLATQYLRLVGSTITVVDGTGFSWANCLVIGCGSIEIDSQATGGAVLSVVWRILPESRRP